MKADGEFVTHVRGDGDSFRWHEAVLAIEDAAFGAELDGAAMDDTEVAGVAIMRGALLRASHDGYASDFGIIHSRAIQLSAEGRILDGEDSFMPSEGVAIPAHVGDEFAIRFHLHPAIKASRLS